MDSDNVPDLWEINEGEQYGFQIGRKDNRFRLYEEPLCRQAEWDVDENYYDIFDYAYPGKQSNPSY